MSEMVKVVVDAMGGDNAPEEPVKAAVEAVKEKENIQVILTGVQDVIEAELRKYPDYPKDRIRVVHASQVIETAEPPVMAIQKKKDSSIVVGLNLVKKAGGRCLCFLRKHRCGTGRRPGDRRQDPRDPETTSCSADPYGKGRFPSDRLWCQCRCETRSSGTVCADGFHLYGKCSGY